MRSDLPAEVRDAVWQMFLDGLEPLREAGQLGSILLQYPTLVLPHLREPRRDPGRARAAGRHAFAVELRNGSWFNEKNVDRTMRFLSDNELPFVMVDEPQGFKTACPPVVAVTSPSSP